MTTHRARLKMLFRLALIGGVGLFGIIALGFVSRAMAEITRSEETAAIFNVAAQVDPELIDAVEWLPDPQGLPNDLPPLVREDITDTWLRAWTQFLILSDGRGPIDGSLAGSVTDGIVEYFDGSAAEALLAGADDRLGLPVHQIGHDLRLRFYSDDGSVLALRSESSRLLRAIPSANGEFEWYESDEQYEAVFVLENDSWRIRHWRRTGATGTWSAAVPDAAPVALRVDELRSITWRPSTQSIEQFLAGPDLEAARSDLEVAAELGFDAVRIEAPFDQLGGRSVEPDDLEPILAVMDLADSAGLDVTIALLHGRTDHQPWHWDADDDHLHTIVTTLGSHPTLIMWELAAGPDLAIDVERVDEALLYAWLAHIHETVRTSDRDTPITIGWSSPAAAVAGPPIGDVVSFAWTGDRAALEANIATLRRIADGRPLVIADARRHTHLGLMPGGLTESEQTVYFADMLTAVADLGLAGFNVTMLRDLDVETVATTAQIEAEALAAAEAASQAELAQRYPATPTPEAREPGPEVVAPPVVAEVTWPVGAEAEIGLLRADGSPKPAAELFAPGFDLQAVTGPGLVEQLTKPFNLALFVLVVGGLAGWLFLAFWARHRLPRPHIVSRLADGVRATRFPNRRRDRGVS